MTALDISFEPTTSEAQDNIRRQFHRSMIEAQQLPDIIEISSDESDFEHTSRQLGLSSNYYYCFIIILITKLLKIYYRKSRFMSIGQNNLKYNTTEQYCELIFSIPLSANEQQVS
jgi:hypothetical protein